jgi:hypothetical protein
VRKDLWVKRDYREPQGSTAIRARWVKCKRVRLRSRGWLDWKDSEDSGEKRERWETQWWVSDWKFEWEMWMALL